MWFQTFARGLRAPSEWMGRRFLWSSCRSFDSLERMHALVRRLPEQFFDNFHWTFTRVSLALTQQRMSMPFLKNVMFQLWTLLRVCDKFSPSILNLIYTDCFTCQFFVLLATRNSVLCHHTANSIKCFDNRILLILMWPFFCKINFYFYWILCYCICIYWKVEFRNSA